MGIPRRRKPQRLRIIFCSDHTRKRASTLTPPIYPRFLSASTFRDFAPKCNDKGRAPCPGACHPVEEVATQHSDGASGETRLEQVGAQLVQNFSGRNESRDSHSSIHIAPVRSISLRTKSKLRLRNGRTLPLWRGRTASRNFQSRIRLCKSKSYRFGFPSPSC